MEYLNEVRTRVRENLMSLEPVRQVFRGDSDPAFYTRYLENIWHYAQHSATVIALAGSRCVLTHPKLADYLMHHALEELGHEQWALDDLAALNVAQEKVQASRPVPACASMIGLEYYVAGHSNPVGLFGWLFVLEAMGDDLGYVAAEAIKKGLNLPGGVKFLAGHGEADKDHTRDIIDQIERNVHGRDLEDVHFIADVMGDLYVRMFAEIGEGK